MNSSLPPVAAGMTSSCMSSPPTSLCMSSWGLPIDSFNKNKHTGEWTASVEGYCSSAAARAQALPSSSSQVPFRLRADGAVFLRNASLLHFAARWMRGKENHEFKVSRELTSSLEDQIHAFSSSAGGGENGQAVQVQEPRQLLLEEHLWVKRHEQAQQLRTLYEGGRLQQALDLLLVMEQDGNVQSVRTYHDLLRACLTAKALSEAKLVRAQMAKNGIQLSRFLGETFVVLLVNAGCLSDAILLFNTLCLRSILSWAAVISGLVKERRMQEGLRYYKQMQDEGVGPNRQVFGSVLQACSILGDLAKGRHTHAEIVRRKWDDDFYLRTCLVDMYCKCGSMMDAQSVFDTLSKRGLAMWNAMIRGYVRKEEGANALHLFEQMQREQVQPNCWTFVSLLKACSSLAAHEDETVVSGQPVRVNCLQQVEAIHAEVSNRGFESEIFVGNTLVDAYAKCGSILRARSMFDRLSQRNVVSWNAMIAGYAQREQGEAAMRLYVQMEDEGVHPDDRTFVGVLKACSSLAILERGTLVHGQFLKIKSLEQGRAIHAEAVKAGYETDLFVANTLIDMYSNCGSTVEARCVFEALPGRNVVSWNAMLAGYIQQEQSEEALELHAKMQEEGLQPNDRTFVCLLKALSSLAAKELDTMVDGKSIKLKALERANEMYVELCRTGYVSDVYVANTLVDLYAKCGSIQDARHVFDTLSRPGVVSWNAMIAGYVQQERGEEALQLFAKLQLSGVKPNDRTFVSALKACAILSAKEEDTVVDGQPVKSESLRKGALLYAEATKMGYGLAEYVGNTVVDLYSKCGCIKDARVVFDSLSHRSVVSWNAMIAGYAQQGQGEIALELYEQMQQANEEPDDRTFVSVLKALCTVAAKERQVHVSGASMKVDLLQQGRALHAEVVSRGFEADRYVVNSLISMYAHCGSIIHAREIFDKLGKEDIIAWNTMIAGYAQQVLDEQAVELYHGMKNAGMIPDDATFLPVLKACSSIGSLTLCRQIHSDIAESEVELSIRVSNTLINTYSKCGSMGDARDVFDSLAHRNLVSWNALIAGYAQQGDHDMTLQCFEEMQQAGLKPDAVTFVSVLTACSHAGMTDKGLMYFSSMSRDHSIVASTPHYVSVIDLLGRAGLFTKAEGLILALPVQLDLALWLALLSACRKYVNVELGRRAFEQAVSIDPKQGGPYMLMSNLYAHAQMWDKAQEIAERRLQAGAKRQHSESWIEVNHKVQKFGVGTNTHPQFQQVRAKLQEVSTGMKGAIYDGMRS